MATIRTTTWQVFPSDVATVFDWVQTPANYLHLDRVVAASGSGKLGSVVSITWLHGDTQSVSQYEVVEYDRPRRVVNLTLGEPRSLEELTFKATGGGHGTLVKCKITTHTQAVDVMGWVAARWRVGRQHGGALADLQEVFIERMQLAVDARLAVEAQPAVDAQPAGDPIGPYLQDDE